MFKTSVKFVSNMYIASLAAVCLHTNYWSGFTTERNDQDPIKTASFYKEFEYN
jgi:hypothetical protein